jgi:hypothetical protein
MAIETPYRVYQSRSSQLWSVTREGLQFFHGEQWTLHPVAEIRTEMANNPIRQLRQISLLPAEVNRVLILLSDRLLEYDAGTRTTGLLRLASDTSLGEFLEMQEGIDETVWISGTYGFASIQGPIRRVSAASRWKEFLLPETNIVNTLQRPFEFPQGTVTASANSATGDGRRFVVRVEDNGIKWFPILGEKIKQALGAWDDGIWGYSSTTLFRIEDQPGIKLIKEPVSGAQYDIASETNGVFWVASSEGLTRYAPLLWRPPAGLEDLQSSMHSLAFDSLGNLWAASPEGLIHIEGKSLSIFPWPESVESLVLPRDTLNITPNGRVVIGAGGRLLVFEPQSQSFSFQQVPPGVQVNILGPLNNGEVCAWFESATNEFADLRGFDGVSFRPLELPPIPLQGAELIVVRETKAGEFWFGTSAGIIHVQPGIENIENHGADLGLDFERVTAIAELADGKLWCGTTSHAYEFSNGRWQRRLRTPDRAVFGWARPQGFIAGLRAHGSNIPATKVSWGMAFMRLNFLQIINCWPGQAAASSLSIRMQTPIRQEPGRPSFLIPALLPLSSQPRWSFAATINGITPCRPISFSHTNWMRPRGLLIRTPPAGSSRTSLPEHTSSRSARWIAMAINHLFQAALSSQSSFHGSRTPDSSS